MRRLGRWMIRLYPKVWRQRYGEEFSALLEDAPAGWRTAIDLGKGALAMQFAMPNFGRLVAAMAMIGAAAGFAGSYAMTPRYRSDTLLMLSQSGTRPPMVADLMLTLLDYRDELLSRISLSRVMQDPALDLYRDRLAREPVEDVIEAMRRVLKVSLPTQWTTGNTTGLNFRLTFDYSDPEKAQKTLQSLITRLHQLNDAAQQKAATEPARDPEIARLRTRVAELEKRLGIAARAGAESFPRMPNTVVPEVLPTFGHGNLFPFKPAAEAITSFPSAEEDPNAIHLKIIDPPVLPQWPLYPNRFVVTAIGCAAGIAGAFLLALYYRLRHSSVPSRVAPVVSE